MDTDEDIVLRHLLEAKAELLRKRLGVDAEIQDVERLIAARRARADRNIRFHLVNGALRHVDVATIMPSGTLVIGEAKGRKGGWRVEAEGSGFTSRVYLTKAEAISAAREMVAGTGQLDTRDAGRLLERTVDDNAGVTDEIVATKPRPVDKPFTEERPKTVRDAVVHVLNSEDRDFQTDEIVTSVLAMGLSATEGSIRSIVSRVVRDGLAIKGTSGRSSYRAAPSQPAARVVREPDGTLRLVGVEGGIFPVPAAGDRVWEPDGAYDAYDYYEPPDPADQDWEPSEADLAAEAETAAEREAERQAEDEGDYWAPLPNEIEYPVQPVTPGLGSPSRVATARKVGPM